MLQTEGGPYLEYRANARLGILRQALIYFPIAVLIGWLFVVAVGALPNSIIAVIILTVFGIPVCIVGYQSLADLLWSKPVTSRGTVDRQFAKGRFLVFGRVRYLLVESRKVDETGKVDGSRKPSRRLFEVGLLAYEELEPGDEIEVVHWPHTNTIMSLEKVASGDPPSPPGRARRDQPPDRASWDELDRGDRRSGWPHI